MDLNFEYYSWLITTGSYYSHYQYTAQKHTEKGAGCSPDCVSSMCLLFQLIYLYTC